jgi:hypothetical protein
MIFIQMVYYSLLTYLVVIIQFNILPPGADVKKITSVIYKWAYKTRVFVHANLSTL